MKIRFLAMPYRKRITRGGDFGLRREVKRHAAFERTNGFTCSFAFRMGESGVAAVLCHRSSKFWLRLRRAVPCVLLLLALVASAQNSAQKVMVECGAFVKIYDPSVGEKEPWYINDHCFIQGPDGMWHMFGITHREPADPENEIVFAHATARTLLQQPWDKQPFALSVAREKPWRETHLWAPDVVFWNGLYYMFYCAGGADHTKYKINLATSSDLKTWTRSPKNPMVVDGYDARDPFLLRVKDKWLMYYCATSRPERGNHVVAYMTSDDLLTWTNREIAFTDPSVGTGAGNTESPFVVQRGDSFYLFIGPRGGYDGTDVFVSHDPFHWNIGDKVGHFAAHAAEVVRDTDGKWYVSRAGWGKGGLYLAPLIWKDGKGEE